MRIIPLIFIFVIHLPMFAQQVPSYTMGKAKSPIKIDGQLNEADWMNARVATNFIQWIPNPDQPSKYKTEVRLLYNKQSIYIAATLYQPASSQLRQMTARDELGRCNADLFTVHLDTYKDKQNAFVFKLSSAGVQQDERLSGGFENGDQSWDAVWNSAVSHDEEKWIAEIEIPYSAIRFSKADKQDWGMHLTRLVRKVNETSYWSPIKVERQGFLAQEGILTGLDSLTPPVRLFLFPYLTLGYFNHPHSTGKADGINRSGGLDVKYGVNESFTIDATLIPDFSQVISDNLVRNLSPFEQQLTENRPFFTEGMDLFNKANLFYTRRVGARPTGYYEAESLFSNDSLYEIKRNPNVSTLLNAVKFSGRTKSNLGIGVFNAISSPMYALVYDKANNKTLRHPTEGLANYNVLVIDRPFKGQSYINFTNTNQLARGAKPDANVSSIEWRQFLWEEKYSFLVQTKFSQRLDEEKNTGSFFAAEFNKTHSKLRINSRVSILSPKYDQSSLGIQFDLNEATQSLEFQFTENKPKLRFLQLYRIGNKHTVRQNFSPFAFREYQTTANIFWLLKNFWDLNLEIESKPFAPVNYYFLRSFNKPLVTNPYFWTGFGGSSDSRKKIFWSFYSGYGFSNNHKTGYYYGEQSLRLLVQSKLELTIRGSITRDDGNIGYASYDATINEPIVGQRFFREYEGNFSIKYNYNPNLNVTARFRHYNSFISYRSFHNVDQNGNWRNSNYPFITGLDENYNLQNIDIFFNWIFKPGSRFILSYKQWLQDAYILTNKDTNSYVNNVYEVIQKPKAYEVTLRIIYFLDYNQLRRKK